MPRLRPIDLPPEFYWCQHCGHVRRRIYKPRLSPSQKECIITLRDHTGWGYMKIARYLHMNHQTVQRLIRRYERYGVL